MRKYWGDLLIVPKLRCQIHSSAGRRNLLYVGIGGLKGMSDGTQQERSKQVSGSSWQTIAATRSDQAEFNFDRLGESTQGTARRKSCCFHSQCVYFKPMCQTSYMFLPRVRGILIPRSVRSSPEPVDFVGSGSWLRICDRGSLTATRVISTSSRNL